MTTSGILTGCNQYQEWMLKTWWHYYSQTNTLPVTFMDFGMSKSARLWCEKRGDVLTISLPSNIPTPKENIPIKLQKQWEIDYANIWNARKGWFYKPFAFEKAPYDQNLWIDLDTFIIKPLDILFEKPFDTLALTEEVKRVVDPAKLLPGEILYNSGVVAFPQNHSLIKAWAQKTHEWNHLFMGDQDILSRLIHEKKFPIITLPSSFNARPQDGLPPETFIVHFGNIAKKDLYQKLYKPHEMQ